VAALLRPGRGSSVGRASFGSMSHAEINHVIVHAVLSYAVKIITVVAVLILMKRLKAKNNKQLQSKRVVSSGEEGFRACPDIVSTKRCLKVSPAPRSSVVSKSQHRPRNAFCR